MLKLEPGEEIVTIIRRHWIVVAAQALSFIMFMPVPYLIYRFIPLPPFIIIPGNHSFLFVFLGTAWILGLWIFFFIGWTLHHLDCWIVTNKRIVDIEQISLFGREERSFRLDRIQDISIETHGLLATIFRFGSIHVQTAGEENRLEITLARHPEKVKEQIMALSNAMIEKFPQAQDDL